MCFLLSLNIVSVCRRTLVLIDGSFDCCLCKSILAAVSEAVSALEIELGADTQWSDCLFFGTAYGWGQVSISRYR